MEKAVIYARQSSGSDDYSESVEAQIENCRKLAESEGLEVVAVFRDLNSSGETYPAGTEKLAFLDEAYVEWLKQQSGPRPFRKGLASALELVASQSLQYLIVNEITRLYRPIHGSFLDVYINRVISSHQMQILQAQGDKIDFSRFDHTLINTIKNQILFEDLQKKRKNSIAGIRARIDNGYNFNAGKIYGVHQTGKDKIKFIKEDAKAIKFIFENLAKRKPKEWIVKECNRLFDKATPFYSSNIWYAARQPIYAGYQYNTKGILIPSKLVDKPIVSFRLWQEVQEVFKERIAVPNINRGSQNWLPLSSRLKCGNCGKKLTTTQPNGRLFYWCFRPHMIADEISEQCRKSRIRFDSKKNSSETETGLQEAIYPFLLIGVNNIYQKERAIYLASQNRDKLQAQYDGLRDKENDLLQLYTEGRITREQYDKNVKRLYPRIEEVNQQLLAAAHYGEATKYRMADYWDIIKKIRDKKLSNEEYDLLISKAELFITVFPKYIEVSTTAGKINIPRITGPQKNSLSKWKIKMSCRQRLRLGKSTRYIVTYEPITDFSPCILGKLWNITFVQK